MFPAGSSGIGGVLALHRKLCPTKNLTDQIKRPFWIVRDDDEIDVAALVVLASGEGAEKVHGLGPEIRDESGRQHSQLVK